MMFCMVECGSRMFCDVLCGCVLYGSMYVLTELRPDQVRNMAAREVSPHSLKNGKYDYVVSSQQDLQSETNNNLKVINNSVITLNTTIST